MNRACKLCAHHDFVPKDENFGISFHWCDKYKDAVTEVKDCDIRNKYKYKRKKMKKQANIYVKGLRRIVNRLRTAWGVLTHTQCAVVFVEKNVNGHATCSAMYFGMDEESVLNLMECAYNNIEDVVLGLTQKNTLVEYD